MNSDDKDTSVTAETVYKGVELVPSGAAAGMFGMAILPASPTKADLCMSVTSAGHLICSTYTKYVTYLEAQEDASSPSKKNLYNHWFTNTDSLELHAVCYSGYAGDSLVICAAAANADKGVLMRNVKLNIVANNLYP